MRKKLTFNHQVFKFISTKEAADVLGDYATVIPGLSILAMDHPQFIKVRLRCLPMSLWPTRTLIFLQHFYHFWGEIIFGAWRVYSTLALGLKGGVDDLEMPSRFFMPVCTSSLPLIIPFTNLPMPSSVRRGRQRLAGSRKDKRPPHARSLARCCHRKGGCVPGLYSGRSHSSI